MLGGDREAAGRLIGARTLKELLQSKPKKTLYGRNKKNNETNGIVGINDDNM